MKSQSRSKEADADAAAMETRSDLKENRSLALWMLGEFSEPLGFRRGFI